MKKLTEREFHERTQAVLRSQRIFMDSGLTKDVSLAFELYQRVCAERDRDLFISGHPDTFLEKYKRPRCPDCDSVLLFLPVNLEEVRMQLSCTGCGVVFNDTHDMAWWMENLEPVEEHT